MDEFRLANTVLLRVIALALLLCPQALAEGQLVQIMIAEADLFRSPDYAGEVVRKAMEGEEFESVTEVGEFYLVEDHKTKSFLYIPKTSVEEIKDA